jgi:hypothetical protein
MESTIVAFAVVAGSDILDLEENVKAAKTKYYDVRTEVESDEVVLVPNTFSLRQNYPNPFNPATTIPYQVVSGQWSVDRNVHATIKIYNVLGQLVRTLVDEVKLPGRYEVIWDGKDNKGMRTASGVYFYRLETEGYKDTKKMVLLR